MYCSQLSNYVHYLFHLSFSFTHTQTHTQKHAQTHTDTYRHTQTHTDTHTDTHRHTQTHTRTFHLSIFVQPRYCCFQFGVTRTHIYIYTIFLNFKWFFVTNQRNFLCYNWLSLLAHLTSLPKILIDFVCIIM
jgi:hypothetical protein